MTALLAAHLWQSTLILLAAWLLTLVFRRNAADIRFLIWFGASAKFLLPLAVLHWIGDRVGQTLPEPFDVDRVLVDTANAMFAPPLSHSVQLPDGVLSQVQIAAVAIWMLGSLLLGVRWLLQWRAVRSALAESRLLPMDLPVPVLVTAGDLSPGVFGIFRPRVILTESVVQELDSQQLHAVLAHELCHVRRRDNLLAAIHQCVQVIFWFHPLVWWVGANLMRERELACDESVIEDGHEQQVYAESILSVCRLSVITRFSGVAASTGGDLTQRMFSIMSAERARPIDNGRFSLLLAAVTLVCFAPVIAGLAAGALRAASDRGPETFDAVSLQLSEPGWRSSARFDPVAGQLVLKNISLRKLIASAYPGSIVSGDPTVIDRARYDIHARWHGYSDASERGTYRELLRKVLRNNANVQLYVNRQCAMECR